MNKQLTKEVKRLRLSVFRSNQYMYAQVIDDEKRVTVAAASDVQSKEKNKLKRAEETGLALAKKAKALGVTKVRYDINHYRYHGRIKALAEGARKGGLDF